MFVGARLSFGKRAGKCAGGRQTDRLASWRVCALAVRVAALRWGVLLGILGGILGRRVSLVRLARSPRARKVLERRPMGELGLELGLESGFVAGELPLSGRQTSSGEERETGGRPMGGERQTRAT